MASSSSSWAAPPAPSLARYRPAILALTAIAAGCIIYYIHEQIWSSSTAPQASLQRSNARRQRRRPRRRSSARVSNYLAPGLTERSRYVPDVPWGTVPVSLGFLADAAFDQETFGDHLFLSLDDDTPSIVTPLRRRMPLEQDIRAVAASDEEASTIRRELEEAFLCFYFWKHIAPSPITDEQRGLIISQLGESGGFSAVSISTALQWHQDGLLTERIEWWERLVEHRLRHVDEGQSHQQDPVNGDMASTMQALEGRETVADVDSEHSWREESGTSDGQDDSKEGQNLGNLLWRIAEEQARKESYVHRGVTCNSCNTMPIKGIRYRCSNCVDFDLCEQCEAMQIHPKTHLFYKVRIPAPFLGNSRQPQPVWYPGRPTTVTYSIPKEIMERIKGDTGYQPVEIEALWEQFRCLAATEWDDDPSEYNLAIDRRTFDKCFVPNTSTRPPAPNLIYDRAFSFYDVDNDGLIGFGEFINGRAALTRKRPDERWKRVFKGYDINNDGFVDRRDFLRMFRAYYALTKELTLDVINGMEDDVSENGARDIVLGSQPISSAFSGAIPPGERLRTGEGKRQDEHGDYQIIDDIGGAVDDRDHEVANSDEVLADSTEAARFGHVQRKGIIGPWVGDVIKNEKWPPGAITRTDLQKVFPHLTELKEVISVQDQHAVRRAAHERVAREHQERQFVRRIALRNRKQRQSFYLDGGDAAKEEKQSESEDDGTTTSLRKNDKSRKDDLVRILGSSKAGEFRVRLIECIKAMNWPLESSERMMNDVFEMIFNEWGGREIAEDLSGYGSLQHDAIDFVATFDSLISLISDAIKVPGPQELSDEQRKSLPSSSSRQSRSSSKVRFRDDVGTDTDDEPESRSRATSISSRSIPVNERWGGSIPEPEKDVGREVLYQVTQEALNELLDPVFRLREDLALAAVRTRRMREQRRAEIIASVKDPIKIKRHLSIYQKRWRLKQQSPQAGYLGTQEIEETFGADELLTFMSRTEAGELDSQTGERCSRCKVSGVESWIWAGGFCSCGKPSAEAVEPTATDPKNPPVVCPICTKGVLVPGKCCGSCGAPSKEVNSEEERLWKILRGGQEDSEREVIKDEGELKHTPNEEPEPLFPPEALEDLHSSVAAFNEANPPALEETIAQKPLEDLLAESGYATASPSNISSTQSPTPDPTLPQNRPDGIREIDPSLQVDVTSDLATSASTSSQHNLHSIQTPSPTVPSGEPPKSPTTDPTLPQNRPNSLMTPSAQFNTDPPTLASTFTSIPEVITKVTINGVPSDHDTGQDQSADDADDAPVEPDTLMYYAALDILEAEDKERGGPGRLSFAEWEDIMKGEKGQALGFLGSWIEIASF
ncbi:MAG: hypothetical protein ALECFALPRED_002647 [Alectoria fallacina]|uniref:Uncharacterized protein n=1 Tax=Alectoria fallacina TaxID=1903189 RepID=A0A8H3EPV1_9LECA|nr:MAG: hypothetical protein ALECFALPRED_002647 [Alectoria fallacina]